VYEEKKSAVTEVYICGMGDCARSNTVGVRRTLTYTGADDCSVFP